MDIRLYVARLVDENRQLKERIKELEQQLQRKNVAVVSDEDIKEVFQYWQSLEIYKHIKLSDNIKQTIKLALDKYTKEQILNAMDNYATVYYDINYGFDCKYTINTFPIDKFTDEGVEYMNYIKYVIKNKYKYF